MEKIANQIIDIYDDPYGAYIEKLAAERPETEIMTPQEKAQIADDDYALAYITKEAQQLNKFPVDTHDNTWLSNKMFGHTFHKLGHEAAQVAAHFIKQACDLHGIKPCQEVEKAAAAADTPKNNIYVEQQVKTASFTREEGYWPELFEGDYEKVASEDSKSLADIQGIANNYTQAQYAMPTPESVKTAAAYFEKVAGKIYDPELKHKYAAAIQLRANELGMEPVKGEVIKYASSAYNALLDGHISMRKTFLEARPELKDELSKIASARKSMNPYQFAQVLNGFDKKAGLSQYYGAHIANPFEATFGEPPVQDQVLWTDKTASRKLTEEEIRKVVKDSNPKLAEYFGKAVAEEMKKDPVTIFNSLPSDSKEIIANIYDGLL